MGVLVMISQFILSLTILVTLHEMGHFFPARWFKTRVDKFFVFFDVKFSLWEKKIGDTVYGLGWLPLGGYVKIAGMIDESMDKDFLEREPQPWEFRSKPAWQRLIIMLGGVTVNFILGFFIFSMLFWKYGEEFLPNQNVTWGVVVDSLGQDLGLRDGDHIVSVGNKPFDVFNPGVIRQEISINNADQIEVTRDGSKKIIKVDPQYVGKLASYDYRNYDLIAPGVPSIVKNIDPDLPGAKAGLKEGDQIIAINGKPYFYQLRVYQALQDLKDQDITVDVLRNGRDTVSLALHTTEDGRVGFEAKSRGELFTFETKEYTFAESIPAGIKKGTNFLSTQIKAFGQMFRGKIKASDSLGGFGTISKLFPTTWNWRAFWNITAILSLILGFMNLLPIPGLDGGHAMFLLAEIITGKKPSDKFLERATMVGFMLLIGLVLYANGLDIWRWLTGQ